MEVVSADVKGTVRTGIDADPKLQLQAMTDAAECYDLLDLDASGRLDKVEFLQCYGGAEGHRAAEDVFEAPINRPASPQQPYVW